MTHTDAEYSSLCLNLEEEDAILDEAARVVEEAQPFDGQLKPLPADDDILAALALAARVKGRARELRQDLQRQLHAERRKAGVL
jgi:hypothetical protein